MAVSDETKEQLGTVQTTGQPRRFVMISKGSKVTSLVVFKRGSLDTQKKKARDEGKGDVSYGVVDGKGQDIKFKLLRSEGFKDAPTEVTALKKFLKEEAEFKCAPSYEIVDELPKVEDDAPVWGVKPTAKTTDQPKQDQPQSNQPQPQTPKPTIGGGRTEAIKGEFEAKLKVVMPEVHKARKVFLTIDSQRIAAGKVDPNSQLTQDLVGFIAPLNDVNARLDSGGKVVKEAVAAGNYHAAIKALDIVATAAKTLNDKQGELIQLLSRHNAELPKDLAGDTKPSTDPEGEREVDAELNRLKKEVADTLAVKSECTALKEAQAGLNEVFQEAVQARMDRDVQGAKFQLSLVETRLEFTKPLIAGWQAFDIAYQNQVPLFTRVDQLKPKDGSQQASLQAGMRTAKGDALARASEGKFKEAAGALKYAVTRAVQAEAQPDKELYEADIQPVNPGKDRLIKRIDAKSYGDPPPRGIAGLLAAFTKAKEADGASFIKNDWVAARANIPALVGAIADIEDWEKTQAQELVRQSSGTSKDERKAALTSLKQQLKQDRDILKAISDQPGGAKLLDGLMESIGEKVTNKSDKEFAMAALEARYKLTMKRETSCTCGQLKGDDKKGEKCGNCQDPVDEPAWSTRGLPQMYKVLGMVPEKHVRGNDSLKKLTRHKSLEASWYDPSEKAVVLNMPRAGGGIGKIQDAVFSFVTPFKTGKGPKIVKAFDTVALHEIGHAVDDDVDFMGKRQRMKPYGAWSRHTPEDLKKVMANELQFLKDWVRYPRKFLDKYLDLVAAKEAKPQENKDLVNIWKSGLDNAGRNFDRGVLLADPGILEADQVRRYFDTLDPRPRSGGEAKDDDRQRIVDACNKVKVRGDKSVIYEIIDRIVYEGRPPAEIIDDHLASLGTTTDPNATPDWKALAKHKAVEWFSHVKIAGEDSGLWDSDSNTKKYAVGSRVYQEAYGNQWWSYEIGARGTLVSTYQFRAPGEWFAECYAAYFVGKLPDKHPVAAWLRKEEEQNVPA